MAFQMNYEDEYGSVHVASYWRPVIFFVDNTVKQATVKFWGHATKAARNAGKSPIGFKEYSVREAAFDQYYSDAALKGKESPQSQAYLLSKTVLDVDGKSFFDTAVNV